MKISTCSREFSRMDVAKELGDRWVVDQHSSWLQKSALDIPIVILSMPD